jgi:hypothetical protein
VLLPELGFCFEFVFVTCGLLSLALTRWFVCRHMRRAAVIFEKVLGAEHSKTQESDVLVRGLACSVGGGVLWWV